MKASNSNIEFENQNQTTTNRITVSNIGTNPEQFADSNVIREELINLLSRIRKIEGDMMRIMSSIPTDNNSEDGEQQKYYFDGGPWDNSPDLYSSSYFNAAANDLMELLYAAQINCEMAETISSDHPIFLGINLLRDLLKETMYTIPGRFGIAFLAEDGTWKDDDGRTDRIYSNIARLLKYFPKARGVKSSEYKYNDHLVSDDDAKREGSTGKVYPVDRINTVINKLDAVIRRGNDVMNPSELVDAFNYSMEKCDELKSFFTNSLTDAKYYKTKNYGSGEEPKSNYELDDDSENTHDIWMSTGDPEDDRAFLKSIGE